MKMPAMKESKETPKMEAQSHSPTFLGKAVKLSKESMQKIRTKAKKGMK